MSMPRAERRLDFLHVRRGGSSPTDGIEKGVELVGGVEAGRVGQGDLLDHLGPRFKLPDHLQFSPSAVVLDRGQRDEMSGGLGSPLKTVGRQRASDRPP